MNVAGSKTVKIVLLGEMDKAGKLNQMKVMFSLIDNHLIRKVRCMMVLWCVWHLWLRGIFRELAFQLASETLNYPYIASLAGEPLQVL